MASKHESRARHAGARQNQPPKERFKKSFAVAALVGVTASVTLGAFAGTYYLDDGAITVEGFTDGTYVTQNETTVRDDEEIIVRQNEENDASTSTTNNLTIISKNEEHPDEEQYNQADEAAGVEVSEETEAPAETEEKTTVEVTIEDINIDTSSASGAAISVQGDGDVVLELDGENAVRSRGNWAGLDKTDRTSSGTLTINDKNEDGGSLAATGGTGGAGIGAGGGTGNNSANPKNTSNIVINGGTIDTKGKGHGAGIGGGYGGDATNIVINGGTVNAQGGNGGAGIGGGGGGNGTNIVINGGTINAQANGSGAGIGGGIRGNHKKGDATVTINGGDIIAKSKTAGAGIGGGIGGSATVTINSGTIYAEGGTSGGAGIGSGSDGNTSGSNGKKETADVTITGGSITAKAGRRYDNDPEKTQRPADDIGSGRNQKAEPTINWTGGAIIKESDTLPENHTHSWGVPYEVTASTCTEQGEQHSDCVCGSVKKERIALLPHSWDAGVETETGDTLYTCTVCGTTRTERAPEPEASAPTALDVTNLYSAAQPYDKNVEGSRVIFAAPAENAVLTGSLAALAELKAQGADTIVFRTPLKETALNIDWLVAQGTDDDVFALTHKGTEASLTVAGWNVRM